MVQKIEAGIARGSFYASLCAGDSAPEVTLAKASKSWVDEVDLVDDPQNWLTVNHLSCRSPGSFHASCGAGISDRGGYLVAEQFRSLKRLKAKPRVGSLKTVGAGGGQKSSCRCCTDLMRLCASYLFSFRAGGAVRFLRLRHRGPVGQQHKSFRRFRKIFFSEGRGEVRSLERVNRDRRPAFRRNVANLKMKSPRQSSSKICREIQGGGGSVDH